MRFAVLTPRLPGRREDWWQRCRDSVRNELDAEKGDLHIVYGPEENKTTSSGEAMNILCQRALDQGFTHVLQVSDDDFLHRGWREALVAPIERDPGIEMTQHEGTQTCDENGKLGWIWRAQPYTPASLRQHMTSIGCMSLGIWERAGGFPSLPFFTDWAMLLQASDVKPIVAHYVEGPWYVHRVHKQTETAAEKDPAKRRIVADYWRTMGWPITWR